MSYARFSDHSDVYVFPSVGGHVECCGCLLGGPWEYHSVDDLIDHLNGHIAAGHTVPAHLLDADTYDDSDFAPGPDVADDEREN